MQQFEPRRFPSVWSIVALIVAINLLIPLFLKALPYLLGIFLLFVAYQFLFRRRL